MKFRIEQKMDKSFKEKLLGLFKRRDRFAQHNNIEVLDVKDGWAKAQVRLTDDHLNGISIAHGGILFSLADVAFGLAANSHGRTAVTLNANISFFNPSVSGQLITAEAQEISLKYRIANYVVNITDEKDVLLATMQCQAYRKE